MRGPQVRYSPEELRFIEAHAAVSRKDLHARFLERFGRTDVTLDHLRGLCTRRGWTRREYWSAADDALLRELYPDTSTKVIARRMGRTLTAVYGHANTLGLAKSEAYLASPEACRLRRGDNVGAAYRFPKGHAPANKGLRRPGFAPGRMKETQFKKGQRGTNTMALGAERIVDGYRYTKISETRFVPWTVNWRPTHVLRWEALHGPVPEGMALKSLDGNRLNVDVANWTLIPRALLPRLNGIHGRGYDAAPAELKPTIMALAKLEHAAKEARSA